MAERSIKKGLFTVSSVLAGILISASPTNEESNFAQTIPNFQSTKIIDSVLPETPLWKDGDRPAYINIPKIDFSDKQIFKANFIRIGQRFTVEVPDDGIATPATPFKNQIFVYGHSRWNKNVKQFSRIQELERGDLVIVEGERGTRILFQVSKLLLVDPKKSFLQGENSLTLTLQTSAKSNQEWILNKEMTLNKVDGEKIDLETEELVLVIKANPLTLTE